MTSWLTELQAVSYPEWLALLCGIAYALLAVRHRRWCWAFGAVSSLLLAWLAAQQRLPMQSFMQATYVAFSIYGFWSWTRHSTHSRPPRITRWPLHWHLLSWFAIALVSLLAAPWLAQYTRAAWPRLDTAIMLASYLATWMTTASKLENWIYWIVIDVASTALYGAQGLRLAALLYVIYIGISVIGLREWWRRWRTEAR